MESRFNKSILPSTYRLFGGLGIFLNFEGYILSFISTISIQIPPNKLSKTTFSAQLLNYLRQHFFNYQIT